MHLSASSIARILAFGSPHVRGDAHGSAFTIICTVEEGAACRFGSGDWEDPVFETLTPRIVTELGWKEIEHSARRLVTVRCTVPRNDPAAAACEADRGTGFEPIPVVKD
jgi:hypothetical protein